MGSNALTEKQAETLEWLVRVTLAGASPTLKSRDRNMLEAALPKIMRASGKHVTPKEGRKTIRMLRKYKKKRASPAGGRGEE